MQKAPDGSNAAHLNAVAEDLAQVLTSGGWHEFEELFEVAAEGYCQAENPEPCREFLRLHVYGRLQNWLRHGFVELQGTRYRAVGEALLDVKNHAVAEHCRNLMETVRAAGKECDEVVEEQSPV